MVDLQIVTRRRKWSPEEKAALLAEVEAKGGHVKVVARRHGISESLRYNWRAAWKAAASIPLPEPVEFLPLGIVAPHNGRGIRTYGGWHDGDTPPIRHPYRRRRDGEREGAGAGAAGDEEHDVISRAPGTKVFLAG